MSKISYSYFALRRLSDSFTPMVSGGFNVYAPGQIVLKKSIDVPKKSDCVLAKQLSKKLQEKEKSFYGDFITNPKHETGKGSTNSIDTSKPELEQQTDKFQVEMFHNHRFKKWISLKTMLLCL